MRLSDTGDSMMILMRVKLYAMHLYAWVVSKLKPSRKAQNRLRAVRACHKCNTPNRIESILSDVSEASGEKFRKRLREVHGIDLRNREQ